MGISTLRSLLESIGGEFANFTASARGTFQRTATESLAGKLAIPGTEMARRRSCADARQLPDVAADPSSSGKGASDRSRTRDQSPLLVPLAGKPCESDDANRGARA